MLFADDLLPGVGEPETTLREGLRTYGRMTFVVLAVLAGLDNLQSSALATLSPDIERTFHTSRGAIVFLTSASGAFLVLGVLPMGWAVRSDPAVIASYLGTDERAIARSGSTSSSLTTKSDITTSSLTPSSSQ